MQYGHTGSYVSFLGVGVMELLIPDTTAKQGSTVLEVRVTELLLYAHTYRDSSPSPLAQSNEHMFAPCMPIYLCLLSALTIRRVILARTLRSRPSIMNLIHGVSSISKCGLRVHTVDRR